ncbi:MAG: alanine racemase [Polyangiales bacterium]
MRRGADEETEAVRPTRAEVDLAAIAHNVGVVREVVAEGRASSPPAVFGVVKADAYGHGAALVARAMQSAGVAGFCVALVEEGLALRDAGVTAPVLVMSGLYGDGIDAAARAGLTPVLYDVEGVERALRWSAPRPLGVHLKVDTGMARLGVPVADVGRVGERLAGAAHLRVEGVMTHFANADCDDDSFTYEQLARFEEARAALRAKGVDPPTVHAAASAAAFRVERARYDMVRCGIALYGVAPFPHTAPGLLPAMRLRTEVISLREVERGAPVGYAGRWRAGRRSVIATIPIGYADGFFRRLSSEAQALVRGARVPVVGNVSMDLCTLDVTDVARRHGVSVGDEVVLLGAQSGPAGFDVIRAEEIAARVGTIPYEVLTAVSRRVPRVAKAAAP